MDVPAQQLPADKRRERSKRQEAKVVLVNQVTWQALQGLEVEVQVPPSKPLGLP